MAARRRFVRAGRQDRSVHQIMLLQISDGPRHLLEVESRRPAAVALTPAGAQPGLNVDEQLVPGMVRGSSLPGYMHLFSRDHSAQFSLRIPFAQRLQPDTLLLFRIAEGDLPALHDGLACAGYERQQRVKVHGIFFQGRVNSRAQQVAQGGPGAVAQPALVAAAAAFGIFDDGKPPVPGKSGRSAAQPLCRSRGNPGISPGSPSRWS